MAAERVEIRIAEGGVVDIRADGGGAGGRAEDADDEAGTLRRYHRHGITGLTRQGRRSQIQFVGQMFEAVIRLRALRGIESIGFNQIGAGLKILPVDAGNHLRTGNRQEVVVAFQVFFATAAVVMAMVRGMQDIVTFLEAIAPVIGFLQTEGLDHRAHGAVQNQDALGQGVFKRGDTRRVFPGQHQGFTARSITISKCGARRSRLTTSQCFSFNPAFSANRINSFWLKPRFSWP